MKNNWVGWGNKNWDFCPVFLNEILDVNFLAIFDSQIALSEKRPSHH